MSLPKIITPEYTIQLKSVKKPVRFRPYLVKEEKIFLTAKQSGDVKEITNAVLQIIRNCTFGEIDVMALPAFDVEFLFLQLRAKSVNNVVELNYECRNFVREAPETERDDRRCHAPVKITVDLDEISITTPEAHTSLIVLKDGVIVEMGYPPLSAVESFSMSEDINVWVPFIASCIRTITDASGEVYEAKDYTQQELVEWIESIGVSDLEGFQQFYETMPSLSYTTTFKCPRCQYEEPMTLRGLETFFT